MLGEMGSRLLGAGVGGDRLEVEVWRRKREAGRGKGTRLLRWKTGPTVNGYVGSNDR